MPHLIVPFKPDEHFSIHPEGYDQIAKRHAGIEVRFLDAYGSDQTMPFHVLLTNNFLSQHRDYTAMRAYHLSMMVLVDNYGRYSLVHNPYARVVKPILDSFYSEQVVAAVGGKLEKAMILDENGMNVTPYSLQQTECLVNMFHHMAIAYHANKHRQYPGSHKHLMGEGIMEFCKMMGAAEMQRYLMQDRSVPSP